MMKVDIYGVFLITGECVPVDARLRRSAKERIARALGCRSGQAARASVMLANTLMPDGEIHTRCEIHAWLDGQCRLMADDIGPTVRAALDKNIGRLSALRMRSGEN